MTENANTLYYKTKILKVGKQTDSAHYYSEQICHQIVKDINNKKYFPVLFNNQYKFDLDKMKSGNFYDISQVIFYADNAEIIDGYICVNLYKTIGMTLPSHIELLSDKGFRTDLASFVTNSHINKSEDKDIIEITKCLPIFILATTVA